jgi:vacuolar iron transporter family protein
MLVGQQAGHRGTVNVESASLRRGGCLDVSRSKYHHRDQELDQLRGFLTGLGLTGVLLEDCVQAINQKDETLLKAMMVFEFRLGDDEQERNPLYAMYMSGRLFLFGAIPSIIPFIFSNDVNLCVLLACILSGVVLFGVGAYKTKTTKGVWWKDGFENLAVAAVGGVICYFVGWAYEAIMNVA